jgi:hypothetical protein
MTRLAAMEAHSVLWFLQIESAKVGTNRVSLSLLPSLARWHMQNSQVIQEF